MKKLTLIPVLIFTINCFSQTLNIQTGSSFSKLDWKASANNKIYGNSITEFFGSIWLYYLNRKHFNLSTNIGYLVKGGSGVINFTDALGNPIGSRKDKAKSSYVTINTEAYLKYPNSKVTPFVSVGPRVDFLVSKNSSLSNTEVESVMYGVNAGAGCKVNVLKKISVGLKGSYLFSLNDFSKKYNIKDKTFIAALMIGIKL